MTLTAAADRAGGDISVAELVGRTLARLGAGHCFGVVGSGNFEVTNALRAHGVPFTAARHEGGAATMADAYARMTNTVALVSVHQGCGLTNAITGIGESAKSRTPVVVLAAETAGASVNSNFTIRQAQLAESVGAQAHRVHSASSVVADIVRAFRTARNERRTVVLNLPLDVQSQRVEASTAADVVSPKITDPPQAAPDAVQALADALQASTRPVFIAGRGGRGARSEILALAEASGALVATSAVANGLFVGEPFNLGISGGFSSPLTAELITASDLIVGFGCALNMWTMRHGALIGAETVLAQIDLDDFALGLHRPVDLGIVGDSAATAVAVTHELRRRGGVWSGYRSAELSERIAAESRWRDVATSDISVAADATRSATIDPRALSRRLDELLPKGRTVSVDSGNFMGYPSAYLEVPDEFGFCFTQAFQSIGLGLYTAIGAAIARPDRLPVLGAGDGGFLMSIAELETAVRLRIPLLCIVYNDAAYGAEVHHFADASSGGGGVELDTVRFPDTDIAAIARGFGAEGATVRGLDDLEVVTTWLASNPERPLVLDAKIASDGGAWWLAEAFVGH